MARIDEGHLELSDRENGRVHGIADAAYFFFESGGERFFQLVSYGSRGREVLGAQSQTIQFNARTAETLIEILRRGFQI
jgi:hypothetical protein